MKSWARVWQLATGVACAIAILSVILNIFAFYLISNLQFNVELTDDKYKNQNGDLETSVLSFASDSHKNLTQLKRDFEKQLDQLKQNAYEAGSDTTGIKSKLDETIETVSWLEAKVKEEWKKGCPQNSITNGSLCYVLHKDKLNYSAALDSCVGEGGFLARVPNLQILEVVTRTFSEFPFFVDGHYNSTAGTWQTSDGEPADYLPWDLNQIPSAGNCVYAYRSSYKSWHCHALFHYLCEF